ncbi:hypothetical protein PRNP1_015516 [Phytophthora ramorum]
MRLYCVVLVAAATLLTSVDASSAATTDLNLAITPDFPVARAFTDGQDDAAAKRFLRAEKAKTEDEEERGVSISSNWVTKLQNVFKTGAASKLTKQAGTVATKLTPRSKLSEEMFAKQQTYLDDAFTGLKLNLVDENANIFKAPKFEQWVKKRKAFNNKNHIEDDSGIEIVSKYVNDEVKLSAWIENAKRDPKWKSMADQFRKGQLSQWLAAGIYPDVVYKLLNVKKLGAVSQNRDLWRQYLHAYVHGRLLT